MSAEPAGSTPLPATAPEIDPDSAPFWEAAAEDRLVLPHCRACRTVIWFPRSICPVCHHRGIDWVEASGRGTIYSHTVCHRGPGPWAEHVPYVIAYVELEEGPRVLTNVVDVAPDDVKVGDPVVAVFERAGDTKVLRFRPGGS